MAEAIAEQAGVSHFASGGLRLISSADADRFVATAEKQGTGIRSVRVFRLVAGHPEAVTIPHARREHGPQQTLRASWSEARRAVRELASADVWFDFLLVEPGRWDAPWHTHPTHLAALPTPNPRLQLIVPPDLVRLDQMIEESEIECVVALADIVGPGPSIAPETVLRDLVVLAIGEEVPWWIRESSPSRIWRYRLGSTDARALLLRMVRDDLASHEPILDCDEAVTIADAFFGLFDTDAQWFTNFEIGGDGYPASGTPLTEATLEGAIGVVASGRAGLLVVTGED
jgi:hypothetical protein